MAFAPYVARHVSFQLDATEFAAEVSDAQLVPAATVQTWQGLVPASQYSDVGPATWTVNLTFAQDYNEALSLATFLFDNEGSIVPMTFEPQEGGAAFTADVVITPGLIGGAVNAYAEATVTLGVQGKPTRTPPVALAASAPDDAA
jgi:hypothetical protein